MMVGAVFILLSLANLVLGGQQQFRHKPRNVTVQEGGEVVLECEISDLHGSVQWTKDGFALGFTSEIPGYPRYRYIGDRKSGVYNLKITNATLGDDAEFQCQVGPYLNIKPIRANARLTVIAPPSSIEIVGHTTNSKIEIRENEELEIECLVKNSKPAAEVLWYKGRNELKAGTSSASVIKVEDNGLTRYNVLSKIKIRPNRKDDMSEYSCQARHEALPHDMPLKATVHLSVWYPPDEPRIDGYHEMETLRRGQTVELICTSEGGNPPAQLIWYKNGEQIRMAYRTVGKKSVNVHTFQAQASDNKAKYKCEASNVMSLKPLTAEVTLTVLFGPSRVTVSGPTEAKVGDKVPLTCTTSNSNPEAMISWTIRGVTLRNTTYTTSPSPEGGFISTSNITVNVTGHERTIVVECMGLNRQSSEQNPGTHSINVLYPPNEPVITGYIPGTNLASGTRQTIACRASGGNPLATITWYKNDKKINSSFKTKQNSALAEIMLTANATDNGAIYKCEASNPATEVPLVESIKLSVYFPPDHVRIRKEPVELKPGTVATLTCESSSSNPPAVLSWWKEGIPIEGATTSSKPGLYGGMISIIELKVNVTPSINGVVYTCQAANEALQRSVHDAFTLDVLYKPIFDSRPADTYLGIEGDQLIVSLEAQGNPNNIAYTWSKDGIPLTKKSLRILADGPVLNITRLSKNDTGVYTCEATNSEGSTSISINVTVNYPGHIVDIPDFVTVGPEEDAHLNCVVDGNPLKEEFVTWRNKNFKDLDNRTSKKFENSTSMLTVHAVSREDAGEFQCVVNNGIGNETYKSVHLLVKYKPELDKTPSKLKAASNIGDSGKLYCRASAIPKPNFKWLRSGSAIAVNTTNKYYIEFHEIDRTTFESVLIIQNVITSDYGKYECEVRNEMGFASSIIDFRVTSSPDTPLSLTVLNVTHDAVTLSWVPGFDGGLRTSYRIRYIPTNLDPANNGYQYRDVIMTDNTTTFVISDLKLDTEYSFSIMALNALGQSKYIAESVKARTSSTPPPSLHSPSHGTLNENKISVTVLVSVGVAGIALLALNALVVGCCLRRRFRNKRFSGI